MKYQSIFTKHTYKDNDQEKTTWYKVGYLKSTLNGGQYIRLFHHPELSMYIFKDEDEKNPETQLDKEE